jgi:hypothetical protein
VLTSANNLAFLLQAQGKLDEAERYDREALDGLRRALGERNPETVVCMSNLGDDGQPRLHRDVAEGA